MPVLRKNFVGYTKAHSDLLCREGEKQEKGLMSRPGERDERKSSQDSSSRDRDRHAIRTPLNEISLGYGSKDFQGLKTNKSSL
jgi:hypothetical protein